MAETETHNFRCNYTIKSARITLAIISAIKKAQGGDASQRTITNRNLCSMDLGIQAWSPSRAPQFLVMMRNRREYLTGEAVHEETLI